MQRFVFVSLVLLALALSGCAAAQDPAPATQAPASTSAPAGGDAAGDPAAGDPAAAYPTAAPDTAAPASPYPTAEAADLPAPAAPSPYPTPEGGAKPAGPLTPPQAPGDDLPDDAVLRLTRSGGIAGMHESWTLFTDNTVEHAPRPGAPAVVLGALPADKAAALLAAARQAGFFKMKDVYGDPAACCDLIFITLTVRDGDAVKSVRFNQTETTLPAGLVMLVTQAEELLMGVK